MTFCRGDGYEIISRFRKYHKIERKYPLTEASCKLADCCMDALDSKELVLSIMTSPRADAVPGGQSGPVYSSTVPTLFSSLHD